jgi:hypothetical protein
MSHRRLALLAVAGAVLGLAAVVAGVAGAGEAALVLVTLAFLALGGALIGIVLAEAPRPRERRPSYTGETAWLRALMKQQRPAERPRRRESAD